MKGCHCGDFELFRSPARGQAPAMIAIDRVSQIFPTSARAKSHLARSDDSMSVEERRLCFDFGPPAAANPSCAISWALRQSEQGEETVKGG